MAADDALARRLFDHATPAWAVALELRLGQLEARAGAHEAICDQRHNDNLARLQAMETARVAREGEVNSKFFKLQMGQWANMAVVVSAAVSIGVAAFKVILLLPGLPVH